MASRASAAISSEPSGRSARPEPSLGVWLVLPLVAAVTLVCTVNAAGWIGRVYPGFFLWQNNFVPAIDTVKSAATRAGLRYHSRLVAIDGVPVPDRRAVDAAIAARPPGTEFRYTLVKGGEEYEIRLPSQPLGLGAFFLTLGNYVVNALVFFALGVAIIFLEPASRGARSFFLFCMNYALYLATSADLVGPSWFQTPYFFLVTLGPVTALQMAVDFPAVPGRLSRLRRFLPPLYVVSLALAVGTVVAFRRSFPLLLFLDRATHLALGAAFLAALALSVLAFRGAESPAARERMKIFLLGLAGASLLPAVVLLVVYITEVPVPLNFLTLGFAVFPAAMAYAIARHDLFGVDRLIRRTVEYVGVTVVIGVVYTALLVSLRYWVMPDWSASPIVQVLVTMVLVALFNPLRQRIQALVDLVYFRAPSDYRATVAAASRALASLLDLEEIVRRLVRIITDQMQVERAEVWLYDARRDAFERQGSAVVTLQTREALPRYLAANPGRALHVGQGLMGGRVPEPALDGLVAIGAALAVPMFFEHSLVGFLALGEKRSGHFYSTDDVELLVTLANQAAVAVQNARAYRELSEVNRELRAARDQLIEAERLAAIGELSAAVAHGIRNPLAGIKTAAELAIREAAPGDPLRESFADILSEADALDSRITELLDFARPFVPNYAPVSVNDLIQGSLRLLRRQIAERELAVDASFVSDLPPHELDAAQIEQVCLALLTNAIEATPAGGTIHVATAIACGAAADGDSRAARAAGEGAAALNGSPRDAVLVELRVRDTGHGIPPEQLASVFKLFYTRKARGTGVGLSIARRIVEAHHGRIEVTSAIGRGTEFRVLLPLRSVGREAAARVAS